MNTDFLTAVTACRRGRSVSVNRLPYFECLQTELEMSRHESKSYGGLTVRTSLSSAEDLLSLSQFISTCKF